MCSHCQQRQPSISRRNLVRLAGFGAGSAVLAAGLRARGTALAQSASGAQEIHWGYDGEAGPEDWAELTPDFALCSRGAWQSPVDIASPAGRGLDNIAFAYQSVPSLHLTNNGHTVQVGVPAGNTISVDGKTYELKQFHFHIPSEHTIAGQAQAMEMHLVHAAEDESLAVVGVLLAEGAKHAALEPVFAALPGKAGSETDIAAPLTLDALLPAARTTYRYLGSLTTPPCSEGVQWLIFTEPQAVSAAQIAAFHALFALDARPVQPSNGRAIEEDISG